MHLVGAGKCLSVPSTPPAPGSDPDFSWLVLAGGGVIPAPCSVDHALPGIEPELMVSVCPRATFGQGCRSVL